MVEVNVSAVPIRNLARQALAGAGVFTAIVMLLHLIRPEYDVVTRFISEYAVTDPVLAAIAGVSLGLGSIALARALAAAVPGECRSRVGLLMLWIFGICFVGVGLFPADEFPTVNPPSWHGIIHALFGLIGFFSFSLGSLLISFRLLRAPWWRKDARLLSVLAGLCFVTFFVFYAGLPVPGLIERIYAALIVAWIGFISRRLMRAASTATPESGLARLDRT